MFFTNSSFSNVMRVNRIDIEFLIYRLQTPHYWVYPNADEHKFSKVEARVTCSGYLVVGRDWSYTGDPFVTDFYEYLNPFPHLQKKWENLFEIPQMETVVDIPIIVLD